MPSMAVCVLRFTEKAGGFTMRRQKWFYRWRRVLAVVLSAVFLMTTGLPAMAVPVPESSLYQEEKAAGRPADSSIQEKQEGDNDGGLSKESGKPTESPMKESGRPEKSRAEESGKQEKTSVENNGEPGNLGLAETDISAVLSPELSSTGGNPRSMDETPDGEKTGETSQGHVITAFDDLADDVKTQEVFPAAPLAGLNLPVNLGAFVFEAADQGSGNASHITIEHVTWVLTPEKNDGVTEYDENAGSYIFTPVLSEEYSLADGVKVPEIRVSISADERTESNHVTVGAFTLTADEPLADGTDYAYESNTLVIKSGKAVTIGMAEDTTQTENDKIVVESGVTADITLTGVNINVSGRSNTCAFDMAGAVVELTLTGDNSLKSGSNKAGLHVPSGSELTVSGTGSLDVNGGQYGAGIGGGSKSAGGIVTINSGSLTARGGTAGAGIGGGYEGAGGVITITGGTVNTDSTGAGIGGGDAGQGGIITISGGSVTAISTGGAGIGGGYQGGAGGTIEISGGTITASSTQGAGIGGGYRGTGGVVTISGGIVTADSEQGAGIGGGRYGAGGTFSTGDNGNAVIYASDIADKSGKGSLWRGIIFDGIDGEVYNDFTLSFDLSVPAGKSLNIPCEKTLTIKNGVTLDNQGKIYVSGTLSGGMVVNQGAIYQILPGEVNAEITGSEVIIQEVGDAGDFVLSSDSLTADDYSYRNNVLTILKDGSYTICMDKKGYSTSYDTIAVKSGVTADIILDGVKIILNNEMIGRSTFEMDGATVNLTLKGENRLIRPSNIAEEYYCAGIHAPAGSVLTINGTGSMEVESVGGLSGGAAIGGNANEDGGTITINGGTIKAHAKWSGAGIGGGSGGAGGIITINGGYVYASGNESTCIGGGLNGAGGTITITGGVVQAVSGSTGCAGIGTNASAKGTFSTGENGNAIIVTHSISDQSGKENGSWRGIIFEGIPTAQGYFDYQGYIYGSQNLTTDWEMKSEYTLTLDSAHGRLTIPQGKKLINRGIINITDGTKLVNNGGILNYGTINGPVNGEIASQESELTMSLSVRHNGGSWEENATSASYGDTVKVIVRPRQKQTASLSRSVGFNTADLYGKFKIDAYFLGTAEFDSEESAYILEFTLSGEVWNKGFFFGADNKIIADFGGGGDFLESSGEITFDIVKGEQPASEVTVSGGSTIVYGTSPTVGFDAAIQENATIEYSIVSDPVTDALSDVAGINRYGGGALRLNRTGTFYIKASIWETGYYSSKTIYSKPITVIPGNSTFDIVMRNFAFTPTDTFTYGEVIRIEVNKIRAAQSRIFQPEQDYVYLFTEEPDENTNTADAIARAKVSNNNAVLLYDTSEKNIPIGESNLYLAYGGNENLKPSTQMVSVTLNRKELSSAYTVGSDPSTQKIYDGSGLFSTVDFTSLIAVVHDDDVTVTADGFVVDVNAGRNKALTVTSVTLGGADKDWYTINSTSVHGTVSINPRPLDAGMIADIASQTYGGSALTPTPEVSFSAEGGRIILRHCEKEHIHNADCGDFYYTYETNVNAGVGKVVVNAVVGGNFSGQAKKDFAIDAATLKKPTMPEGNYTYTGEEQVFIPVDFDENTMEITGSRQNSAGIHLVTVSLKNRENYRWDDGSTGDIQLFWTIDRAVPSITVMAEKKTVTSLLANVLKAICIGSYGDTVVLTAVLSKIGENGTIPSGTVTFKEGDTVLIADVPVDDSGKAGFEYRPTAGDHTVTAEFSAGENTNYMDASGKSRVFGVDKSEMGVPVIAGSHVFGETLTVQFDEPADGGAISYQWYRVDGENSIAVSGGTEKRYTLSSEDIGKQITVKVWAERNYNETVSAPTELVEKAEQPAPADGFVDDENNTFGFTMMTGTEAADYEYSIDGGTTWADVTINPIYVGNAILHVGEVCVRLKETDTYKAGAVLKNGLAFTAVLEGNVSIDGSTVYGETLTAAVDGVQGDAQLHYQWRADGSAVGSDSSTYTIEGADIGRRITVEVTADQYAGALYGSAGSAAAKKALTVTAQVKDKTYDGTTQADIEFTLTGQYEGDDVGASAVAVFGDKNVGMGKTVILSDFRLTGSDKDYYSADEPTDILTADITPRSITAAISCEGKSYDGTNTAEVTYVLNGKIDMDDVSAGSAAAVFDDADAGRGKTVTASGIVLMGDDAGNYTLTCGEAVTKADIMPKSVIPAIDPIAGQTYTGSPLTPLLTVRDGETILDMDTDYTVNYADNINAGTASASITLIGNYTGSGSITFEIEKLMPSITFHDYAPGRDYDGGVLANPTESQLAINGGDYGDVSFTWYPGETAEGIPLTGAPRDAGNYVVVASLAETDNTEAASAVSDPVTITPKTVNHPVITLSRDSYEYDGTDKTPEVAVKDGDTVIASGEYLVSYVNNRNAGTAVVEIADAEGGNYTVSGSTVFIITKAHQKVLSVTPVTGKNYGDEAFSLSVSGGSGTGQVTYSVSDNKILSLSESTAEILGAGTVEVTAVKAGDSNYYAAVSAPRSVTIGKKTVTVTADDKTAVYNESIPELTVTIPEGTLAGGDTEADLGLILSTQAVEGSEVGTYDITGTGDSENYDVSVTGGRLTIIPADIPSVPKAFRYFVNAVGGSGEVDLGCELEKYGPTGYTLGTLRDDNKILSGEPQLSAGRLSFDVKTGAVGDTAVISVTVTFKNYNSITFDTNVELTAQTPVDITAAAADVNYDGKPYTGLTDISADGYLGEFAVTYKKDGVVLEDAPVNAGSYTVTVTPVDKMFKGEWNGSFSIHRVPAVVRVKDVSMVAGDPKPEYRLEISGFVNGETILGVRIDDSGVNTAVPGRYDVTAGGGTVSGGGADNYSITYEKGCLTVKERLYTVKSDANQITSVSSDKSSNTGVKTGDETNIMLWVVILLAAGVLSGIFAVKRRVRVDADS